jgi:hypothetical protein
MITPGVAGDGGRGRPDRSQKRGYEILGPHLEEPPIQHTDVDVRRRPVACGVSANFGDSLSISRDMGFGHGSRCADDHIYAHQDRSLRVVEAP